jgi:hypothetical protein
LTTNADGRGSGLPGKALGAAQGIIMRRHSGDFFEEQRPIEITGALKS